MKIQVDKEHYGLLNYVDKRRWNSYYQQLTELLKVDAKKYLYIGVGDGMVVDLLKKEIATSAEVFTFDFDATLEPDICGDICEIEKCVRGGYDCIACFQVLEHLPFSEFEKIIAQFFKITKKGGTVLISLPDRAFHVKADLGFRNSKTVHFIWEISKFYQTEIPFNGEHYWELGTRTYTKKRILGIAKKYFEVEAHYNLYENTYHWFLVLKKK